MKNCSESVVFETVVLDLSVHIAHAHKIEEDPQDHYTQVIVEELVKNKKKKRKRRNKKKPLLTFFIS